MHPPTHPSIHTFFSPFIIKFICCFILRYLFLTFLCKLTSFYTNSVHFLSQFPQPPIFANQFWPLKKVYFLPFHKTVLLRVGNHLFLIQLYFFFLQFFTVTASNSLYQGITKDYMKLSDWLIIAYFCCYIFDLVLITILKH